MYHSLFNHSPSLLTAFYHERVLNFVKYFFSIDWKHVAFHPLILLMWTVFFLSQYLWFFLCWISDLQILSPQLIFCCCCYPFCCLPFFFEVTLVCNIICSMCNIIFLLLYTLHWQSGKSNSTSLRKNSLFNKCCGSIHRQKAVCSYAKEWTSTKTSQFIQTLIWKRSQTNIKCETIELLGKKKIGEIFRT